MSSDYLAVADRIGHELCASSYVTGDRRTWPVRPDYSAWTDPGERVPAEGALYAGSAGIALFLAHLSNASGDRRFLTAACEGVRHSLDWAESQPPGNCGLWSGPLGACVAAVLVAEASGEDALRDRAARLVQELVRSWRGSNALDIIAGEAGAITALLWLEDRIEPSSVRALSLRMGEHVLRHAIRTPEGWSWGAMPGARKPLTGYAHGTAGFAHALAELAAVTGERRFMEGALEAVRYEQSQMHAGTGNWLDYRTIEVSEVLRTAGEAELARQIANGVEFTWKPGKEMLAWCHGAPGISACRARIAELAGDAALSEQALCAAVVTRDRLFHLGENFSLCHGIGGNIDAVLRATRHAAFDRTGLFRELDRGVAEIHREGRRWPSGAAGGTEDPTLMLGTAGIGFAYLRAAGFVDETPLLFEARAATPLAAPPTVATEIARQQPETADELLASSLLTVRLDLLQDLLDAVTDRHLSVRDGTLRRSHRLGVPSDLGADALVDGRVCVRTWFDVEWLQLEPLPRSIVQWLETPQSFDALRSRLRECLPSADAAQLDAALERQLIALRARGVVAQSFSGSAVTGDPEASHDQLHA